MSQTLLTAKETSRRLGKSVRTVHRWAATGQLEFATKVGHVNGHFLFDPAVVEAKAAELAAKAAAKRKAAA